MALKQRSNLFLSNLAVTFSPPKSLQPLKRKTEERKGVHRPLGELKKKKKCLKDNSSEQESSAKCRSGKSFSPISSEESRRRKARKGESPRKTEKHRYGPKSQSKSTLRVEIPVNQVLFPKDSLQVFAECLPCSEGPCQHMSPPVQSTHISHGPASVQQGH